MHQLQPNRPPDDGQTIFEHGGGSTNKSLSQPPGQGPSGTPQSLAETLSGAPTFDNDIDKLPFSYVISLKGCVRAQEGRFSQHQVHFPDFLQRREAITISWHTHMEAFGEYYPPLHASHQCQS
ncbi:hypothetical protein PM082_007818 [Marasmius tenuissimus]|nr:hypothetical protein PM082_007818 [Marasmius tenuissimus]